MPDDPVLSRSSLTTGSSNLSVPLSAQVLWVVGGGGSWRRSVCGRARPGHLLSLLLFDQCLIFLSCPLAYFPVLSSVVGLPFGVV